MDRINHIYKGIIYALYIGLTVFTISCDKEHTILNERITVNLGVNTRASDPQALYNDDKIKSIAIYIFNNNNQVAEWSFFQTGITATSPTHPIYDWDKEVSLFPGTKTVYVLVNYHGVTFNYPLANTTQRNQLDALVAENALFNPSTDGLLMVGKLVQTIDAGAESQYISISPVRMTARIDLHPYKGMGMSTKNVVLNKVTLVNQQKRSNITYGPTINLMPEIPLAENKELQGMPITISQEAMVPFDYSTLINTNAKGSFYSYASVYSEVDPTKSTRIKLDVTIDGIAKTFESNIGDGSLSTTDKFSLKKNNLYRIVAIITDYEMKITYQVIPWTSQSISIPAFN